MSAPFGCLGFFLYEIGAITSKPKPKALAEPMPHVECLVKLRWVGHSQYALKLHRAVQAGHTLFLKVFPATRKRAQFFLSYGKPALLAFADDPGDQFLAGAQRDALPVWLPDLTLGAYTRSSMKSRIAAQEQVLGAILNQPDTVQ